jgi:MFS family permease
MLRAREGRLQAPDKWFLSFLPIGIAGGATSPLGALFAFRVLHASIVEVGLISSLTSLASVPAYILWGHLSDSSGQRKRFVVLGFAGMASSLLLMGLSRTLGQYYVANVLAGFLTAASGPVGTVLLMETSRKEEWADKLAVFSRIGGVGWVAGLLLGALWLQAESWGFPSAAAMQGLFVISAALSILSTLLAWRWVRDPEETLERHRVDVATHHLMVQERARYLHMRVLHLPNPFNHRGAAPGAQGPHHLPRALWVYMVAVALFFTGFSAFYGIFPIFLSEVLGGVAGANTIIFLVYVASQVTQVLLYPHVGHWVSRWGSRRAQVVATAGRVVLFPSFALLLLLPIPLAEVVAVILLLHAAVGLCWALINVSGSTLVSGLAPREARCQAQGVYNAVQGVGAIVGPVVGGIIAEIGLQAGLGYLPAFLACSGSILVGIAVLLTLQVKDL